LRTSRTFVRRRRRIGARVYTQVLLQQHERCTCVFLHAPPCVLCVAFGERRCERREAVRRLCAPSFAEGDAQHVNKGASKKAQARRRKQVTRAPKVKVLQEFASGDAHAPMRRRRRTKVQARRLCRSPSFAEGEDAHEIRRTLVSVSLASKHDRDSAQDTRVKEAYLSGSRLRKLS